MSHLEELQEQQKELRHAIKRYVKFYYVIATTNLITGIFSLFLIYVLYKRTFTPKSWIILGGIILIQLGWNWLDHCCWKEYTSIVAKYNEVTKQINTWK